MFLKRNLVSHDWSLIFIALFITPFGNDNTALTKLTAKIWECGDIYEKKSDKARNNQRQPDCL